VTDDTNKESAHCGNNAHSAAQLMRSLSFSYSLSYLNIFPYEIFLLGVDCLWFFSLLSWSAGFLPNVCDGISNLQFIVSAAKRD